MKKGKKVGPQDYWHIGPFYIQKSTALLLLSACSILIIGKIGIPHEFTTRYDKDLKAWLYYFDDIRLRNIEETQKVGLKDSDGNLRYLGDIKDGACTGEGKTYNQDGECTYEGHLVDNRMEGQGTLYFKDEQGELCTYTGDMSDNRMKGKGTLKFKDKQGELCTYTGDLSDNRMEGKGILQFKDKEQKEYIYTGYLSDNRFEGEGVLYSKERNECICATFHDGQPQVPYDVYQGEDGKEGEKLRTIKTMKKAVQLPPVEVPEPEQNDTDTPPWMKEYMNTTKEGMEKLIEQMEKLAEAMEDQEEP